MTTGTEPTLPPMGALAIEAAYVAARRAGYGAPSGLVTRAELALAPNLRFPFSREYYRIIDAIAEQHHGR